MAGALLATSLGLLLFGLVCCVKMGREENKKRKGTVMSDNGASFKELSMDRQQLSSQPSSLPRMHLSFQNGRLF